MIKGLASIVGLCSKAGSSNSIGDSILKDRAHEGEPYRLRGIARFEGTDEELLSVCCEAARESHYEPRPSQVQAAYKALQGCAVELELGEGKTLACAMAAAVLAARGSGKGSVHVISANDFLTQRDAEWMEPFYSLLGFSVGALKRGMSVAARLEMYSRDVVYAPLSEFSSDWMVGGFMARDEAQVFQKDLYAAVIDEVDHVVVDMASRPLGVQVPGTMEDLELGRSWAPKVFEMVQAQRLMIDGKIDALDSKLRAGEVLEWNDAVELAVCEEAGVCEQRLSLLLRSAVARAALDEVSREKRIKTRNEGYISLAESELYFRRPRNAATCNLSSKGEEFLGERYTESVTSEATGAATVAKVSALLDAMVCYERDCDYLVEDGKIVVVDGDSGRPMPSARFPNGIHGAIEIIEGCDSTPDPRLLVSVSVRGFLSRYEFLCGMSGTVLSDEESFLACGLDPVRVEPSLESSRQDLEDQFFDLSESRDEALAQLAVEEASKGRCVLVGALSVEAANRIAVEIELAGAVELEEGAISLSVLTARNHHAEANLMRQAGRPGRITVSAKMAGRGVDVKISDEVNQAGGMLVLGLERSDSARADRQLAGRCGRQGAQGQARFMMSLEDDLFAKRMDSSVVSRLLEKMGSGPLESPIISRAIAGYRKAERNRALKSMAASRIMDEERTKAVMDVADLRFDALNPETDPWEMSKGFLLEGCCNLWSEASQEKRSKLVEWLSKVFTFESFMQLTELSEEDFQQALAISLDERRASWAAGMLGAESKVERMILVRALSRAWADFQQDADSLCRELNFRSMGGGGFDVAASFRKDFYELMRDFRARMMKEISMFAFKAKAERKAS